MIFFSFDRFNNSHFIKFVFVGALNTIVGYGIFVLFIIFGSHHFLAVTISNIIGIIHSYFWNKFFTFRSRKKTIDEPVKFVTVYFISFVFNLLFLWLFVDIVGFAPIMVQAFVLIVVIIISFLGHKYWTFYNAQ